MEEVHFDEKLPYIINYVQQQSQLVQPIPQTDCMNNSEKKKPTKKPRSKTKRPAMLPSQLMEVRFNECNNRNFILDC